MILFLINLLSLSLLIYDTLGYMSFYSKKNSEESNKDQKRLVQTWIVYLGIKYFNCVSGCGDSEFFLFSILNILLCLVRLLIVLPITTVSEKLANKFIEDSLFTRTFESIKCLVMSKINCEPCKEVEKETKQN